MYLEYFWTERMKWILRNKKKSKGCLFCKIAKNGSKFLLKRGDFIVMMNRYPYSTGHLLIFPKKHVKNFEDLEEKDITEIFSLVKKCLRILKIALKPKGFNIGINLGTVAGASIEHLHIHIVPRYGSDAGFMEVVSSTKVMPEPLEKTYKKLKKFTNILEES